MMRLFYNLLLAVFLLIINNPAFSQEYVQLLWSDEFDVEGSPNSDNWTYDLGSNGWGNSEVQNYTNSSQNIRVENGLLIIEARKNMNGQWSSARLKSQGKKSFKYGKIVFRAKLPQGSGTWPALWMLGDNIGTVNWPACGEIDVMEHIGRQPGQLHASLHTTSSHGATINTASRQLSTFATSFHEYACIWTADKITFLIDDVEFYTYSPASKNNANWPFDQPFFFILNIAMGGVWGSDPQFETGGLKNGIDPALSLARMEVDYVRVYSEFTGLTITGNNIVDPQSDQLIYTASNVIGASYEWEVPEGVEIIDGQGTHRIRVKWNDEPGNIEVTMNYLDETYDSSLEVLTVLTPTEPFELDLDLDNWFIPTAFSQAFAIEPSESAVTIDFDVAAPRDNPYIEYILDRPLNMEEFSRMEIQMSTQNPPGTMRIDLIDNTGTATALSEIFRTEPLNSDGNPHPYIHYFERVFPFNEINPARIAKIRFYINYGLLATAASGKFTIHSIGINKSFDATIPDAPTDLTAVGISEGMVLSWTNTASNEKGLRIYRRTSGTSEFNLLNRTAPVNATEYTDRTALGNRLYDYKIAAFNQFGESAMSNIASGSIQVTSLENRPITSTLLIYPNPAKGSVVIQSELTQAIKIADLNGRVVWTGEFSKNEAKTIDLESLRAGMYLVIAQSGHSKLILY
ncbi:MAG: family 16 glycosylhydrolase [Cyclobacteriaceae bacterium]